MARACCLVAVAPEDIHVLTAGLDATVAHAETSVANLDIAVLNSLDPEVIVIDIDRLAVDPVEALRQLRFVLPDCIIVAYTAGMQPPVVRACHNAGANALLSKSATPAQIITGLRSANLSGCFTDPRFIAHL
ncbi:MAG TPA: hypothetical protein VIK27_12775 [Candidatus Aquilonibacter sp.]